MKRVGVLFVYQKYDNYRYALDKIVEEILSLFFFFFLQNFSLSETISKEERKIPK